MRRLPPGHGPLFGRLGGGPPLRSLQALHAPAVRRPGLRGRDLPPDEPRHVHAHRLRPLHQQPHARRARLLLRPPSHDAPVRLPHPPRLLLPPAVSGLHRPRPVPVWLRRHEPRQRQHAVHRAPAVGRRRVDHPRRVAVLCTRRRRLLAVRHRAVRALHAGRLLQRPVPRGGGPALDPRRRLHHALRAAAPQRAVGLSVGAPHPRPPRLPVPVQRGLLPR